VPYDTLTISRNYGSLSDDHTKLIQEEIDKSAGGILRLPPGVYNIHSLQIPKKGITLIGLNTTFSLIPSKGKQHAITIPSGATDILISGLKFDGSLLHRTHRVSAIWSAGDTTGVAICDNSISEMPGSSITIGSGDSNWTIGHNYIEASGRFGILASYATIPIRNLTIHNNTITGSGRGPIAFVAGSGDGTKAWHKPSAGIHNATITENISTNNGGGISGYSSNNKNITVSYNISSGNGRENYGHAAHWGGSNITLLGNIFKDTRLSAIYIAAWPNGNSYPSQNIRVENNIISTVTHPSSGHGIQIRAAYGVELSNNIITNASGFGIEAGGRDPSAFEAQAWGNIISLDSCHNTRQLGAIKDTPRHKIVTSENVISERCAN